MVDINASWIWDADNTRAHDVVVFRHRFTVAELPANAVATIAAETKYWLWINGRQAKRSRFGSDCHPAAVRPAVQANIRRKCHGPPLSGESTLDSLADGIETFAAMRAELDVVHVGIWHRLPMPPARRQGADRSGRRLSPRR